MSSSITTYDDRTSGKQLHPTGKAQCISMERSAALGIIYGKDIHACVAERCQQFTQFLRRVNQPGIRIFRHAE